MKFRNIHFISLLVVTAVIFTGLMYGTIFFYGQLVGMGFTFILLLIIMGFLLIRMVEEMYGLLISPPARGRVINPFRLMAFGRVLWQYPKEGSFVFMDRQAEEIASPEQPMEIDVNPLKVKRGPKTIHSQEERFKIAKAWFDSQQTGRAAKTQKEIAVEYHVSPRYVGECVREYKDFHSSAIVQ